MALTASEAPAPASASIAPHKNGEPHGRPASFSAVLVAAPASGGASASTRPKTAMHPPQETIARVIARPWRCTRPTPPESTVVTSDPAANAASSAPAVSAPPREHQQAHGGEQRPGPRGDHRDDVQGEGHAHVRPAAEQSGPGHQRGPAGAGGRGLQRGHRRQPGQQHQGEAQRHRVDGQGWGHAEAGDDQPGQQRPDHGGQVLAGPLQGVGRRQQGGVEQPGHHRAAGRGVDALPAGLHAHQHQHHDERARPEPGLSGQPDRGQPQHPPGDQRDGAPVVHVGTGCRRTAP